METTQQSAAAKKALEYLSGKKNVKLVFHTNANPSSSEYECAVAKNHEAHTLVGFLEATLDRPISRQELATVVRSIAEQAGLKVTPKTNYFNRLITSGYQSRLVFATPKKPRAHTLQQPR